MSGLSLLPLLIVVGAAAVVLSVAMAVEKRRRVKPYRRRLTAILTVLVALVAAVVVLPVSVTLKQQLLTILGILASGVVAFSSTPFVSSIVAGFMLRSIGAFRPGDFIEIGGTSGRVTETGLYHTEVQTPDRDLIVFPNRYLAQNPIRVTQASGTFVTAEVSIGYEVARSTAGKLLTTAAERSGLTDSFTQILDLEDSSVRYRVSGFLEDVQHYVSKQSELRAAILDVGAEMAVGLATPGIVYRRELEPGTTFVPPRGREGSDSEADSGAFERRAFDKAIEAESLERLKTQIDELEEQIETARREKTEVANLEERLALYRELLERRELELKNRPDR